MSVMARRKSPDLTIRLTGKERSAIDLAAEKRGERAVSSWARGVLLREAARETDEERTRRVARLIATMRKGFRGDAAHADEVEKLRAEGWKREGR
jgi:predicted nucleic acid-binding protein